jgi:SHS2 domain-containing protein
MDDDLYFEHDADVGIIGRGETVEAAFEAAARAMWDVMVDTGAVRDVSSIRVEFEEPDVELALVTWLNDLLAKARVEGMVLGRFSLRWEGDRWRGEAWGEPWRDNLEQGVEVKGATLTALSVKSTDAGWEARCVVDV